MALLGRVFYGWRVFATGLSFAFFGVGGLLLALTVFPVINLGFAHNKPLRQKISSAIIKHTWRVYILIMRMLGVMRLRVEGAEILQAERGAIIIANHPSLIDIVVLVSLMSNARCIVKQAVWDNPFMRSAVRSAGYIPNTDDPLELIKKCRQSLNEGGNIIIFPEGSRTVPGQPLKMQRGFAHLACTLQAPLRLVEVRCTPPTLLKGQKWYDIPRTRPIFSIRVAERLDVAGMDLHETPSRAVRQVSKHVAARYEEMLSDGRA